jgi:methionyl-tRNA synthetase
MQGVPHWLVIVLPILVLIAIWDGVWKAIAMWKCGRNNQLAWFVCVVVFNTAGILPIIYLLWGQRDCNERVAAPPTHS